VIKGDVNRLFHFHQNPPNPPFSKGGI
jgi:hypothetical protein